MAAFGTTRLPDTRPFVQRDRPDSRFPYATRIDQLEVQLAAGFTRCLRSVAAPLERSARSSTTTGTRRTSGASPHVLRWFLARGWRVVTVAMPLAGENAAPGFDRGKYGLHDELVRLKRPLGVFLEPVVAVVNYTGADVMIGLSGGGWTTVVAAAIDPAYSAFVFSCGIDTPAMAVPSAWARLPAGSGAADDSELPSPVRVGLGTPPPPTRALST